MPLRGATLSGSGKVLARFRGRCHRLPYCAPTGQKVRGAGPERARSLKVCQYGCMQALSSYSQSKHADVARALASLRSRVDGLSADTFATAKGFFARFIWPDLPIEISAKLGGLVGALHAQHPELDLNPVDKNSPEWSSVFHGWSTDLESAGAIETVFSAHFPKRVSWVESERDRGGGIAAKLRIEGLGETTPPPPETPPSLRAGWRASWGEVTLNLFWKDSMAIPPGPLSAADLGAFQASVREISHWAERRVRPILDTLHQRLKDGARYALRRQNQVW